MNYYRLEYPDGVGVFQKPIGYIDSLALQKLKRLLYVPKIFQQDPLNTRSWFTEYGYHKYKPLIDKILEVANAYPYNRNPQLIVTDDPGEILSKGKVQIVTKKIKKLD